MPAWDLLRPSTSPWSRLVDGVQARTDVAYLCAYRATAGGPYGVAALAGTRTGQVLGTGERRTLELWDNDGIVNTASMLWPDGEATRLVDGDHGDIIGHYRLVDAIFGPPLRRYHTYDLLRSDSGFGEGTFRSVWREVLDFCAGSAGAAPEAAAAAAPAPPRRRPIVI